MPDPIDEAREATEAVQRSRLRVSQVWQHRERPHLFVRVLGYDQHLDGLTSLIRYAKVVRQHEAALGNEAPNWAQAGAEQTMSVPEFNEHYRLFWEDGNKELGGGVDLTEKLKQIRRDPGRVLGRTIDLIGDRRREYEAQHARPEATENWWWQRLDERTHPAALELSQRRLDLLFEIGERQAELDRIDTALSSLASIEIPRAGE